ncbi:hypothetical protein Pla86_12340 [Planctomycetes bacterium Pla86]|uniref:HMA domain-containing protein n=1 Tax=Engelhardtia mirabilis TaxID=2528011 RepID=A0A518BGQ2_9BACT|nr:hypothetical protein Pla133_12340 [Planctomycetes bacterium Pla133]QDV00495.1 hypothetical protein Pla86_12340 [Planctomycetes bacterium Pla86]
MNETGAIDVYFEDQIEILVANPDDFSVDAVREVLTANEIEFSEVKTAG